MRVLICSLLFSVFALFSGTGRCLAQVELPLSGGSSFSNLAVGELDGDASDGLEVVAAASGGEVRAYKNSGALLWSAQTPNVGCGSNSNRVHSSPSVGDLNGDGAADVGIGFGAIGTSGCDGGVVAFDGKTGARLWAFSAKKFAKKQRYGARFFTVFSTPALADVDGDGKLEIGFAGFDRNVYLLNADGSVRWYYNAADTSWSSPAFADVDGDGKLELVAATDISQNKFLRPATKNGGFLYAFKTLKRKKIHIGFRDKSAYRWQQYVDQVPYSSPVVADVVSSNPGAEIVIGSGCYFRGVGNWIKILSASNGAVLRTIKTAGCSSSSAAVGDIRGNGSRAIVHLEPSSNGKTQLAAYDADTGAAIWTTPVTGGSPSFQAPIIADIDANGSLEVIVARASKLLLFNGATGVPLHCLNTNECADGELSAGGDVSRATPAVADLDGDGFPELLVNLSSGRGRIAIWSGLNQIFQSPSGLTLGPTSAWPAWRGGYFRVGSVGSP